MVASCTRSLGCAIWRDKSNPSLKVKRQFEKSNCYFAWWRESRKPTWGGSPSPSTAGQGGRVGEGLPSPWPRPPTYIRRGRAAPPRPTPCPLQTLALSRRRHHLILLPPPPRANPSRRLGLPQALAAGLALSPWCV